MSLLRGRGTKYVVVTFNVVHVSSIMSIAPFIEQVKSGHLARDLLIPPEQYTDRYFNNPCKPICLVLPSIIYNCHYVLILKALYYSVLLLQISCVEIFHSAWDIKISQ